MTNIMPLCLIEQFISWRPVNWIQGSVICPTLVFSVSCLFMKIALHSSQLSKKSNSFFLLFFSPVSSMYAHLFWRPLKGAESRRCRAVRMWALAQLRAVLTRGPRGRRGGRIRFRRDAGWREGRSGMLAWASRTSLGLALQRCVKGGKRGRGAGVLKSCWLSRASCLGRTCRTAVQLQCFSPAARGAVRCVAALHYDIVGIH